MKHELDSVIPGGPFQHPWVLSDPTAFVPSRSSLQLVSQPLALVFPSGCAAWLAGCLLMLEGCSWRKEAACFVPCLCGALFGGFQAGRRGLFVRAGCCPVTAGSVLASSVVSGVLPWLPNGGTGHCIIMPFSGAPTFAEWILVQMLWFARWGSAGLVGEMWDER